VQRHVPADRLLVYDVQPGWEPLCRFLGVDVPVDASFPHLNDAATMRWIMRGGSVLVFAVGGGIAVLLLWGVMRLRQHFFDFGFGQ